MNEVRLIDANELLKHVISVRGEYDDSCPFPAVGVPYINGAPTVEAEPVRHGYWTEVKRGKGAFDYCFKCSCCHKTTPDGAFLISPDFCPWCGAKMDGGTTDETNPV